MKKEEKLGQYSHYSYEFIEKGSEYAKIKSQLRDSEGYLGLCRHMTLDTFNKYLKFIRRGEWKTEVTHLIESMQSQCEAYDKNKHYYIKKLYNIIDDIIRQYHDSDNLFVGEVPDMVFTLLYTNFYEIQAKSKRFTVERDADTMMITFKTTHGRTVLTVDQEIGQIYLGDTGEIFFNFSTIVY